MRTTTCRSRLLALCAAGALVAPALLSAQPPDTVGTRTHVVRAGDTLWRLATEFLGDGHRWRDILRLNEALIPSPDQLVVGSTIRLPAAPGRAEPPPPAPPPAGPPPVTDAVARADTVVPPVTTSVDSGRTIFFGRKPAGGFAPLAGTDSSGSPPRPPAAARAARAYDVASTPFVAGARALETAGRCVGSPGAAAASLGLSDRIAIALPRGATAHVGSRFLLARRGPSLPGLGDVVFPTAIVRTTGPVAPDGVAPAEVVAQFDVVTCQDPVLPFEVPTPVPAGVPAPVASGAVAHVVFVASEALLPTLQHVLIVDFDASAGLRPGDQLTVFSDPAMAPAGTAPVEVAVAIVVRVGPRAASALVIRQTQPAIRAGLPARITAKLP
jgi:hypothetical protein